MVPGTGELEPLPRAQQTESIRAGDGRLRYGVKGPKEPINLAIQDAIPTHSSSRWAVRWWRLPLGCATGARDALAHRGRRHTVAIWRRAGPRQDLAAAHRAITTGLNTGDTAELLYRDWMLIERDNGNRAGVHRAIATLQDINRRLDVGMEPETEEVIMECLSNSPRRGLCRVCEFVRTVCVPRALFGQIPFPTWHCTHL
ncbi:hypothetical protein [Streptomyces lydicus]|uniref:hypothetical protein n=1 Tax=Streptomyces lydicus TaxID=47763 RepID=UPI0038167096